MTKRPKVDAKLNQEEQPPKCCPTFTVTASTLLYGRLGLSDEDVVKRLEPTTPKATGGVRHPTVVAKLHEREVYLECGIVHVLVVCGNTAGWIDKGLLKELPQTAWRKCAEIEVTKYKILSEDCVVSSYPMGGMRVTEQMQVGTFIERLPVELVVTECGTVQILVLHLVSSVVGWISLDRSSRRLQPLIQAVGSQENEASCAFSSKVLKAMSIAQWKEEVHNVLKDAAALRTRLEVLEHADPKPSCKICFDSTADTAFQPCGHVTCQTCAYAWYRQCPFCRQVPTGTLELRWD